MWTKVFVEYDRIGVIKYTLMDETKNRGGEGEDDPINKAFWAELGDKFNEYVENRQKDSVDLGLQDILEPEPETEWGYLETRRPAPGFETVAATIPDEELQFIFNEILAKQDTAIPDQADNFFKLAATLKAFDPERFEQYATKGILSASNYYNLENRLKTFIKTGQYQQLIRDANKLKALFPGDADRINYDVISAEAWSEILNCLEAQVKGGHWRQFAELYALAFELNPRKLSLMMPIEEDWQKLLRGFFKKSDMTFTQKVNFSSDMDTITLGKKERQNFSIPQKTWKINLTGLQESITKNTLAEIAKFKKDGTLKLNLNALADPIYHTARCKYAIVTE